MEEKVNVNFLILEVTRRCNECCEHCLRGDAQLVDMDKEVIDRLLKSVSCVSSVTFSGGEPTLNLPLIHYFFEKAKECNVEIGSFAVITNGKENQMELAQLLLQHYPDMTEPEYCYLAVSEDQFHESVPKNILSAFSFYEKRAEGRLIAEGRAKDNFPDAFVKGSADWSIEAFGGMLYVDELYVNAYGQIFPDCDLSYETQDKEGSKMRAGSLLDEDVYTLLSRINMAQEVAC